MGCASSIVSENGVTTLKFGNDSAPQPEHKEHKEEKAHEPVVKVKSGHAKFKKGLYVRFRSSHGSNLCVTPKGGLYMNTDPNNARWEDIKLVEVSQYYGLRTASKKFISASSNDNSYECDVKTMDSYEKFELVFKPDGRCAIKDWNSNYLTVEHDGKIVAKDSIGEYSLFWPTLASNHPIKLKQCYNRKYLSLNDDGKVRCNEDKAKCEEHLYPESVGQYTAFRSAAGKYLQVKPDGKKLNCKADKADANHPATLFKLEIECWNRLGIRSVQTNKFLCNENNHGLIKLHSTEIVDDYDKWFLKSMKRKTLKK